MQKKQKLVTATILGAGILGGILIPTLAFANNSTINSNFVSSLAQKLGIDQSKVQSALDQTKQQMKTQRQTDLKIKIDMAVKNGKITQRQADILNAIESSKSSFKIGNNKDQDTTNLTDAQKQDEMKQERLQRETQMLDTLNASGLNTTTSEIQSTLSAAQSTGIMSGRGMHGMGRF